MLRFQSIAFESFGNRVRLSNGLADYRVDLRFGGYPPVIQKVNRGGVPRYLEPGSPEGVELLNAANVAVGAYTAGWIVRDSSKAKESA